MKFPNCSCVQYPLATALEVQTYVFCYEIMISYMLYVLQNRQTNGQIIVRCSNFAEIWYVCPFVDHHGEMSWRYVVEGDFLKIKTHTDKEIYVEYHLYKLENLPTSHYMSVVHSLYYAVTLA